MGRTRLAWSRKTMVPREVGGIQFHVPGNSRPAPRGRGARELERMGRNSRWCVRLLCCEHAYVMRGGFQIRLFGRRRCHMAVTS